VRLHFREQWRRMVRFEGEACRRFDEVIAVSTSDAEALRKAYGLSRVSVVETGVDLEYFTRPAGVATAPREIVFLGSMDWMPNQDAVRFFVSDILPRVRASVPDAVFRIVGRNPPAPIRALADAERGIEVTGSVPDVRPYLTRAAVCVVPLRVGGGTRLKIYEAMAMEVPVVSTRIGMEGLPVTDGRELLVADTPEDFAGAVVRLLEQPALRSALAAQAVARVRRECGWRGVAVSFAEICRRVVDGMRVGGVPA
jgi:glycosyltransferase involved in cell wall biosynthesis